MNDRPIHDLKCVGEYFPYLWSGAKTFEVRLNDRDYRVGDRVRLREYDSRKNTYSGRSVYATIGYVTGFKQVGEHVVFSLLDVARHE